MSEVLEGDVELRRHQDGRVEVLQAPPRTRMSLALLVGANAHVQVSGNRLRLAGQVTYRVVGWDAHGSALLLERDSAWPPDPDLHLEPDGPVAAWPAGAGTKGA